MTYTGTVKEGRIELPASIKLPEGAAVRVEIDSLDDWLEGWKDLAHRVGAAWDGPQSAVDTVSEMRR